MEFSDWVVHRLDGRGLGDAEGLRAQLDAARATPALKRALVVPAAAAVDHQLAQLVAKAAARDLSCRDDLDALRDQHALLARQLTDDAAPLTARLEDDTRDLADVLQAVAAGGDPRYPRDLALSYGALWASRLVAARLRAEGEAVEWLDARDLLVVPDADDPDADWGHLAPRGGHLEDRYVPPWLVVPAGLGATSPDDPVRFHHAGTDRACAALAALLGAGRVVLWDVDAPAHDTPALRVAEAEALHRHGCLHAAPARYRHALAAGVGVSLHHPARPARATRLTPRHDDPPRVRALAARVGLSRLTLRTRSWRGGAALAAKVAGALRDAGLGVSVIATEGDDAARVELPGHLADLAARRLHALARDPDVRAWELTREDALSRLVAVGDAEPVELLARLAAALADAGVRAVSAESADAGATALVASASLAPAMPGLHEALARAPAPSPFPRQTH